jgi:hypothetical protein
VGYLAKGTGRAGPSSELPGERDMAGWPQYGVIPSHLQVISRKKNNVFVLTSGTFLFLAYTFDKILTQRITPTFIKSKTLFAPFGSTVICWILIFFSLFETV